MPEITYNTDMPTGPQRPSASQPLIQANFNGIFAIWDVNHYTFTSIDAGKHKFLQLPIVTAPVTVPTTAANELALYTKLDAVSTLNQMYIRRPSDGSEIPFTAFNQSNGPNNFAAGYCWLPSGLLMKYDRATYDVATEGGLPFNKKILVNTGGNLGPNYVSGAMATLISPTVPFGGGGNNFTAMLVSVDGFNADPAQRGFTVHFERRDTGQALPLTVEIYWMVIGKGVA